MRELHVVVLPPAEFADVVAAGRLVEREEAARGARMKHLQQGETLSLTHGRLGLVVVESFPGAG